MTPDTEIEPVRADEAYEAPDAVRLGTADGLTAGVSFNVTGDLASAIN